MQVVSTDRLLFLHVPKTAGMSMRTYLLNQYLPEERYPPTDWAEAAKFDRPIQDFRLYAGHYRANFIEKVPPGTRTLVVLRDPVQRLLSALRHLRRDPDFHPDHVLTHGKTLSEIIRTPEIMANQYNVQVAWLAASADPFWVDDFLEANPDGDAVDIEEPDTDEGLFQHARQALEAIDFIGFTEDLRPLLTQLSEEMNFHQVTSFPRLNEGRSPAAETERLGKADIARVRAATVLDQRLYDFAKDLVEQRRVLAAIRRLRDSGRYEVQDDGFEIALEAPIPGSGWYEPETEGQGYYRWTGPDTRFTLDLLLAPRPYVVQIEFNRRADNADGALTVTANMTPLTVEQIHPRALDFEAHFVIPAAAIAAGDGAVRLVFDAGATGRPTDNGGTDDRILGIVVFRITVSPVPDETESVEPPAPEQPEEPREIAPQPILAERAEAAAPVAMSIIGYCEQQGETEGLFDDHWVGPRLHLTILPHRPVRRVTVHGWFHDDTPNDGELSLRIDDQTTRLTMTPGMFELSIELPTATSDLISLTMEATNWLLLEGPDGRKLVFVLQRIALDHGG